MIANTLIIIVSTALFVYWFRYTCRLILSTRTTTDFSLPFAQANQLNFPQVQAQLAAVSACPNDKLDSIRESLHRDYQLLTYLFSHTGHERRGDQVIERRMLMLDFRIMGVWYAMARRISATQSRQVLEEMTDIVSYFANSMGEQLSSAA